MKRNRIYERHTRRLETDFLFEDRVLKGISSDLSEKGLFIRTHNCLTPGSFIEFRIYMKDGRQARGEGIVRRANKSNSPLVKNGMGIELKRCDRNYLEMLEDIVGDGLNTADVPLVDELPNTRPERQEEARIIVCTSCAAKNRVALSKLNAGPKCGRCRTYLPT